MVIMVNDKVDLLFQKRAYLPKRLAITKRVSPEFKSFIKILQGWSLVWLLSSVCQWVFIFETTET